MAPVQSDPMICICSNPHSGIQRFFQDFRLPDYTLDSFLRRLLDVVSSTTFSSGENFINKQNFIMPSLG